MNPKQTNNSDDGQPSMKKKRGRPKKTASNNTLNEDDVIDENRGCNVEQSSSEKISTVPEKPKRGRPMKNGAVHKNNTSRKTARTTDVQPIDLDDSVSVGQSSNCIAIETQRGNRKKRYSNEKMETKEKRKAVGKNYLSASYFDVGKMDTKCDHCGAFHYMGKAIKDSTPRGFHFNECCRNGAVVLDGNMEFKDPPDELVSLLTGDSPACRNYQMNIRNFNSAFAFASLNAKVDCEWSHVKIHGAIHHQIGGLTPKPGTEPRYTQMYFMDPEMALEERNGHPANKSCSTEVMKAIQQVMHRCNPYAKLYLEMYQAFQSTKSVKELRLVFLNSEVQNPHDFDGVVSDQMAAVYDDEHDEAPIPREVEVRLKDGSVKFIEPLSSHIDPLTYPLIFANGEQGWSLKFKNDSGKKVTMLQYAAYRMAVRSSFSVLHHSRKLFHQIIIDWFLRSEYETLKYLKRNNDQLRKDTKKGLQDYLTTDDKKVPPGSRFLLPSSFYGSPRALAQHYQDAMCLVREFGKPTLFITFTCNPKWTEITEAIGVTGTSTDRPDIVEDNFELKLKQFLYEIKNENIFGEVVAYTYTIEFQKRGLPHMHMLLILADKDKFSTPEEIDQIVSAEIPDPNEDPILHRIVLDRMIHIPCDGKKHFKCKKHGKCSKGFPKPWVEETKSDIDGYPLYRRRENEPIKHDNRMLDNRWVVPYNPYCLKRFNAHINVEVCSSINAIKYIYKYINKGPDRANVGLFDGDEIQSFQSMRYCSGPEAARRIKQSKMHGSSHAVIRLDIHLPNEQTIVFHPMNVKKTVEKCDNDETKLTAWFKLNAHDENARKLLYTQAADHYVWIDKKGSRHWKPRERFRGTLARMYNVKPGSEEFFLRLLLLNVRGATCFGDLMKFENVSYDTFREAAEARGLTQSAKIWIDSMMEASSFETPKQLRLTFSSLCLFCSLPDPVGLFNQFKVPLSEDFVNKGYNDEAAVDLCLSDIQTHLLVNSRSCAFFGLPSPKNVVDLEDEKFDVGEAEKAKDDLLPTLNNEQREIYDEVMAAIVRKDFNAKNLFFIEAKAGCGKTHLYKTLLHTVRSMERTAFACAPTGIAATLLNGGRTAHSLFSLPLNMTKDSVVNIKPSSKRGQNLAKADLIVIDEVVMGQKYMYLTIDNLLQDLTGIKRPFGGKVVVFGGDFRQILPVIRRGSRSQTIESTIKRCYFWPDVNRRRLLHNMRATHDADFAAWIGEMGDGNLISDKTDQEFMIDIPLIYRTKKIVRDIFGESISAGDNSKNRCAILCPTNKDIEYVNDEVLNLVQGDSHEYTSVDEVENNHVQWTPELWAKFTPNSFPPHKLILKIGCHVMLLRNMQSKLGLCNGTRLKVTELHTHCIRGTILDGEFAGESHFIHRFILVSNDDELPFTLKRQQLPLKLAFAMTINKSQGQTLDKVGILLPKPVFSHGQLYVACSRVRTSNDIKIQVIDGLEQVHTDEICYTRNVVWKEIFKENRKLVTKAIREQQSYPLTDQTSSTSDLWNFEDADDDASDFTDQFDLYPPDYFPHDPAYHNVRTNWTENRCDVWINLDDVNTILTPMTYVNSVSLLAAMKLITRDRSDILILAPDIFFNALNPSYPSEELMHLYEPFTEEISSHQVIVQPICHSSHWMLVVWFKSNNEFRFYNSFETHFGHHDHEFIALFKLHLSRVVDITDISSVTVTGDTPQQIGGFDCGIFCLLFCLLITRNIAITKNSFDMSIIPSYRRRIAHSLIDDNTQCL